MNIILIMLLVVLQYRLWFSPGGIRDVRNLDRLRQEFTEENRQLQERNLTLAAEVIDLKQGLDAIEERARSEMGMVRKGEIFYQVIDRNKDAAEQTSLDARPRP